MHIFRLNKPIFGYAPDHPARRLLEAFVECRTNCVGKEIDGVDQEWFSETDMRTHKFSSFAYAWLSFDIELDGWPCEASELTDSEEGAPNAIPRMARLMAVSKSADLSENTSEREAMLKELLHIMAL